MYETLDSRQPQTWMDWTGETLHQQLAIQTLLPSLQSLLHSRIPFHLQRRCTRNDEVGPFAAAAKAQQATPLLRCWISLEAVDLLLSRRQPCAACNAAGGHARDGAFYGVHMELDGTW